MSSSESIIPAKTGFFKNHADTLAIVGVNIALSAVMISMWVSNTHRNDATNVRMDSIYQILMNNAGLTLPKSTTQGD